tara:strand:- start:78572 stop:79075 length:504 start_codon:yes stop_codon:yes gene_type:complete
MKAILFLSIIFMGFQAHAQKVKLKNGEVLIDKVVWLTYQDCGTFDSVCSLYNENGDEIIFLKTVYVKGAEPITASNPEGKLIYVEVIFLGQDKKYEIGKRTQKNILSDIYKGNVVNEDGSLNTEKVERLVEKYGSPYSDRLNASTNTVIIKDESSNSGSGINIKIGN